jgi:hypothetical protein
VAEAPGASDVTDDVTWRLRNLAISALRTAGRTNIAAALHHMARQPTRPLALLEIPI